MRESRGEGANLKKHPYFTEWPPEGLCLPCPLPPIPLATWGGLII